MTMLQVTVALAQEPGPAAASAGSGRGAAADGGEAGRLELDLTGLCAQMDEFGPGSQHARRVALSVHHIEVRLLMGALPVIVCWAVCSVDLNGLN